MTPKRNKN